MKQIKDFPEYYIEEDGLVYKKQKDGTMKPKKYNPKYVSIVSGERPTSIKTAKLVAMAYIDNPKGFTGVKFKNGNELDIRPSNIEWVESYVSGRPKGTSKKAEVNRDTTYYMYDAHGKIVAEFENLYQAASELGLKVRNIEKNIEGGTFLHNGMYVSSIPIDSIFSRFRCRQELIDSQEIRVLVSNLNGEKISVFDSAKQAAMEYGLNQMELFSVLLSGGGVLGDNFFSYEEDGAITLKMISPSGDVVKEFPTTDHAEKETGINKDGIIEAMKTKHPFNDRFWSFSKNIKQVSIQLVTSR